MGPSVHVIDPKSFVRLAFGQPNKPFGKYDLTPGRWPDVWGLRPQTEGLRPIGGLRPLVWFGKVGMIWYGLVWYGMVWLGMDRRPSWYSMVWYGMVWFGMVWFAMVWFGMVWYGLVWYGPKALMVWFGMVWYGMVWFGMVWYGLVWFETTPIQGYYESFIKIQLVLAVLETI